MKNFIIKLLGGVILEDHHRIIKHQDDLHKADLAKVGTVVDERQIFMTMDNGEEFCDDTNALAVLLVDGILECNEREYVDYELVQTAPGKVGWDRTKPTIHSPTTMLFVNCNDLFYWACADGEDLPQDEIGKLYRLYKENPKWGWAKWCCLQRKLRPQVPIVEMMKKDGYWDAELEALEAPCPS